MAARMATKVPGRLHANTAALFVCDIQEKFRNIVYGMPSVIDTTSKMVRGAKALGVPIVVTEQYPKALGNTVPELSEHIWSPDSFPHSFPAFPKTKFSMYVDEVDNCLFQLDLARKERGKAGEGELSTEKISQILLCGIETHVCILQTASDLLERGYEVHLVVDGVSSQRPGDRQVALQRLLQMGCFLCTSEMALFQMCGSSKHPSFKQISAIAKEDRPDQLNFNSHL
jgi:nicotinamidase-related amidase